MGSLVPFSITTNCTMKSLLIFATVLAVGLAEEAKAVVATAPYLYGYPGYAGAPLAYNYAPVAYANAPYTYATAPVAAAPAPVVAQTYAPAFAAPVPAPAVSSQFAAQDEFGNTHYGYSNLNSAKQESGNAFTGVAGSYQYVDANGVLQTVNYVADALGFRVADSRLPVHNPELPVAPVHEYDLPVAPVYDGVAPEPVQDTPEVAAAKADFAAKFEEVANRQKRESDPMLGFGYGYGYNSPWLLNRRYQSVVHNGLYAYNRLGYYGYGYGRYYY